MKLCFTLIFALAVAPVFGQTPQPSTKPATASDTISGDVNIDPTADTDNPTLLKAQIMILQNAREAERAVLASLTNFQNFEKYDALAQEKRKKLNEIMQRKAQQEQRIGDIEKARAHNQQDHAKADAETAALAKANKEKAEAAKSQVKQ